MNVLLAIQNFLQLPESYPQILQYWIKLYLFLRNVWQQEKANFQKKRHKYCKMWKTNSHKQSYIIYKEYLLIY